MPPKHKCVAEIGNLEQHANGSWRAYAKGSEGLKRGPLRPCKEEALADLSKAREGAANSTDVARGLATRQAFTRSRFARDVKKLSSGDAVVVPSSASEHAETPHLSHGDAEAEASPPAPPPGDAAESPPPHSGDADPQAMPEVKKDCKAAQAKLCQPETEAQARLCLPETESAVKERSSQRGSAASHSEDKGFDCDDDSCDLTSGYVSSGPDDIPPCAYANELECR